MTPDITPASPAPRSEPELVLADVSLTIDDLNGHTVEQLVDYVDAGLTPPDASIDNSAGCQIALAAIRRLRALTDVFLEDEARTLPPLDESWIAGILSQISVQAMAGRDIPLTPVGGPGEVVITEAAARAIVRAAGDNIDGLLIGRVRFSGDVTVPREDVTVSVDATILWGTNIPDATEQLRVDIIRELGKHTRLNVVAVDVAVHDIHQAGNGDTP